MHRLFLFFPIWLSGFFLLCPAYADITRVYHPYVNPLENEIEFRMTRSHDSMDEHLDTYTLGYGKPLDDKTFIEAYIIATRSADDSFDVDALELEGLYQLTERGAHAVDYGLLVELERKSKVNVSEITATLLMETEFDRFSATANLGASYEFGTGIDNEYDSLARLQLRYRLQPAFQPAIEVYLDEFDKAAGPAAMGLLRLTPQQKLRWEAGILFGLDTETPDTILRAAIDYEF